MNISDRLPKERAEECVDFLSRFTDESGKVNCTLMRQEFIRLRSENDELRRQVRDWECWLGGVLV